MSSYIVEVNANQGNSGEAFVSGLLGRRGFTVNPSLQDRFGWDFYIEHVVSSEYPNRHKFEGLVQVKSTRVESRTSIQIKLSALLHLIHSNSVALIAFVRFEKGKDLPTSILFSHVGKDVIRLAHHASHSAILDNVDSHKAWVTIDQSHWLEVPFTESGTVDIYKKFLEYSKEFGEDYSSGKAAFYHRLNPVAKGYVLPKEMPIGDAYLKFKHPKHATVVHKTTAYMACIGPRYYYRLRSPFCEIEINGNHIHSRFGLNATRPLSELDSLLPCFDIMEEHGWSIEVVGAVTHLEPMLLAFDVRDEDMKPITQIIRSYRRAFYKKSLPDEDVHFFHVAGKFYGFPDLFQLVTLGGALRVPTDIPKHQKSLMIDMIHIYDSFCVVITWEMPIAQLGGAIKGSLCQVGAGRIHSSKAFGANERPVRAHDSLPIDYKSDIFIKSSSSILVPKVREYRDPETVDIF